MAGQLYCSFSSEGPQVRTGSRCYGKVTSDARRTAASGSNGYIGQSNRLQQPHEAKPGCRPECAKESAVYAVM